MGNGVGGGVTEWGLGFIFGNGVTEVVERGWLGLLMGMRWLMAVNGLC